MRLQKGIILAKLNIEYLNVGFALRPIHMTTMSMAKCFPFPTQTAMASSSQFDSQSANYGWEPVPISLNSNLSQHEYNTWKIGSLSHPVKW